MKQATAKVPFFLNDTNMNYLLKGMKIGNLKEVHDEMLFKISNNIYAEREPGYETSEYPDIHDIVVAHSLRYIKGKENNYLEIELVNSLYYSKLREPVIKINGYCEIDDKGYIIITKVTRLTLADKNPISILDI